jgi:redox-sensing transcriptional repressor
VSDSTVRRLSFYLRILKEIRADGTRTVSSARLADLGGLTSAQVRKDLSVFGNFGVRGRGYDVASLEEALARILGLDREWKTVVVGAGRLGSALSAYPEFRSQGFHILGAFDSDPARVGHQVGATEVRSVAQLQDFVREHGVSIGVIATPASAAQSAADGLVAAGVRGILNFASTKLDVPDFVAVRNVNLAIELEGLSFALADPDGDADGAEG